MPGAFFDDMREYLHIQRRLDNLLLADEVGGVRIGSGATSLVAVNQARSVISMWHWFKVSKEPPYNPRENRMHKCSYPLLKELQFLSDDAKEKSGRMPTLPSDYLVEFYGASLSDSYVLNLYLEKCQFNLLHYLQSGTKTATDIASLSKDVMAAVTFLHAVGVVHRDVKLENILVTEGASGMCAKLCDFGTMFELDSSLESFLG